MDPISAVGFASSIIAFVDFSLKFVKGSYKVYQAGGSAPKCNDLEASIQELQAVAVRIPQEFPGTTIHEKALRELAENGIALAKRLETIVQSLKGPGKKSKWGSAKTMWKSWRNEDEIRFLEKEIEEYRSESLVRLHMLLCERQSAIVLRLDEIQSDGQRLSVETSKELASLRMDIERSLRVQRDEVDPDYMLPAAVSGAPPAPTGPPPPIHIQEPSSAMVTSQQDVINLTSVREALQALQFKLQILSRENRILQNLLYDSIYAREDSIQDVEAGTFKWILKEPSNEANDTNERLSVTWMAGPINTPSSDWKREYPADNYPVMSSPRPRQRPWVDHSELLKRQQAENWIAPGAPYQPANRAAQEEAKPRSHARQALRTWLRGGGGVFHISGRAGSGKSTLMKLLCQSQMTSDHLQHWAGTKQLIIAQFFFWNSGDKMQVSLDGLYRSVLFEILRRCPELIPRVFPDQWALFANQPEKISGPLEALQFRPPKIKSAWNALIRQREFPDHRICIFIDGLDEYKGDSEDHYNLAKSIQDWATSNDIKFCVSSRPYNEFLFTFSDSPDLRIHLHEITKPDIYVFSREALEGCSELSRISEGVQYLDLVNDIVEQSDGVFLWARLVVRLLLRSIRRRDSLKRLREVIAATPRDLNQLYSGILDSIDPTDRVQCDKMLLVTALNPFSEPLNALAYTWLDDLESRSFPTHVETYSDDEIRTRHEDVRLQLNSLTKGLLETVQWFSEVHATGVLFFSRRVQCFHRTVLDYVKEKSKIDQLGEKIPYLLTKESYARLKLAEILLPDPSQIVSVNDTYANRLLDDVFQFLAESVSPLYSTDGVSVELLDSFRDAVNRNNRLLLVGEYRPVFYGACYDTYVSSICIDVNNRLSFGHYACYHGRVDYLKAQNQNELQDLQSEEGGNLLLSALLGGNAELCRYLMSSGLNAKQQVKIKWRQPYNASMVIGAASVWVLFSLWMLDTILSGHHLHLKFWNILDLLLENGMEPDSQFLLRSKFGNRPDTWRLTVNQLKTKVRTQTDISAPGSTLKRGGDGQRISQYLETICGKVDSTPASADNAAYNTMQQDFEVQTVTDGFTVFLERANMIQFRIF